MAQAHDRLVKATWTETAITEVVEAALGPHRMSADRFRVAGPDLALGSKQALALTMALHELATNALKHGALSVPGGHLDLFWSLAEDENGHPEVHFCWRESNGPEALPPEVRGFGTQLIQFAIQHDLKGQAELSYRRDGLVADLRFPQSSP